LFVISVVSLPSLAAFLRWPGLEPKFAA
jgi:hypothetical protein